MRARIPSLDGLRAVSILLVLFGHSAMTIGFPARLRFLATIEHIGVLVFFVISGFLITTLLMQEKNKVGSISLRAFYTRRFLRIFPVAYLYIAVIATLSSLGFIELHPHDFAYSVSYLMNYNFTPSWWLGHLWSLSLEEQFYLLWPTVVVVLGFKRSSFVAWFLFALGPVSSIVVSRLFPHLPRGIELPHGADSIATGCLLAINWKWLRSKRWFTSRFFTALLAIGVAARLVVWHVGRSADWLGYFINVLTALLVFRCVAVPDDCVGRLLNSRGLTFIGVLSYSIYVWQQLFLPRVSSWSIFPLNLIAALSAATLSYYFVERPFLRLKRRFAPTSLGATKEVGASAFGD
jgi:peptidoglycan/LPS O-acetylase OafA/YrhL